MIEFDLFLRDLYWCKWKLLKKLWEFLCWWDYCWFFRVSSSILFGLLKEPTFYMWVYMSKLMWILSRAYLMLWFIFVSEAFVFFLTLTKEKTLFKFDLISLNAFIYEFLSIFINLVILEVSLKDVIIVDNWANIFEFSFWLDGFSDVFDFKLSFLIND